MSSGETFTLPTVIFTAVAILQTIGFFSPYWYCKIPQVNNNIYGTTQEPQLAMAVTKVPIPNNGSCDLQGLFYTGGIRDNDIFGLCTASLAGAWLFSAILIYCCVEGYKGRPQTEIGSCVLLSFLVFQFLAGVAGFICLLRYDKFGWSAIVFVVLGAPIFIVIMTVVGCYVAFTCCKVCDEDDGPSQNNNVSNIEIGSINPETVANATCFVYEFGKKIYSVYSCIHTISSSSS